MKENLEDNKVQNQEEIAPEEQQTGDQETSAEEKAGSEETGSESSNGAETEENESAEESSPSASDELAEMKEKYLRLYSEFDNYRRRTSKERLELIQTANEELMLVLIPILDDFQRAEGTFADSDKSAVEDGVRLITQKLQKQLQQKGLKAMAVKAGDKFDPEIHEAISQMPVKSKKEKGKIIDIIEDGYYLGEKVIRFAKVVIGS